MKNDRANLNIFLGTLLAFCLVLPVHSALANAWWGYGARSKDWVLDHGGTIIKCEIDDYHGKSSEYKMVMYRDDGHYVEKEFGTKVTFDDAKDGDYKISAYRGGTEDRTTYKGGKKFASIKFTAHPGETIKIEFDYKDKKAEMTTDYVERPKPIAKKEPAPAPKPPETAPVAEPEPTVEIPEKESDLGSSSTGENIENPEPQIAEPITPPAPQPEKEPLARKGNPSFFDFLEDIIHPDAVAGEMNQDMAINQNAEEINALQYAWGKVKSIFAYFE